MSEQPTTVFVLEEPTEDEGFCVTLPDGTGLFFTVEQEPWACLIAAAPDLLAALEWYLANTSPMFVSLDVSTPNPGVAKARAAIAKARVEALA